MSVTELTREAVKIVDDSPDMVLTEMIADYQQRTGKTLQPAHIERLLINTFAYRETLLRAQINESFRQQHPRFATGLMLDLCGDDVNTPRLAASAARCTLRFQAADFHSEVHIPVGTLVGAGDVLFATIEQGQLTAGQPETVFGLEMAQGAFDVLFAELSAEPVLGFGGEKPGDWFKVKIRFLTA